MSIITQNRDNPNLPYPSHNEWYTCITIPLLRYFLERNERPDGRGLKEYRDMKVSVGTITTAEGSATVRMGNTSVVCGIKAEICMPTRQNPDKGFVIPNVELYPSCSPLFRAGPPGEKAMATSQFLMNTLQNSNVMELKDLGIIPYKYAWCLYCDIICLDYDGNLSDATLVALIAALQDLRLPGTTWDEDKELLEVQKERTIALTLKVFPVSTTFTIYSNDIQLVDPTAEDEEQGSGEVSVVMLDDGTVAATHKSGGHLLLSETLMEFIVIAKGRVKEVNETVRRALSSS
ncbi:exosome complex component RRP43-like isoform X2 [Oratosquilla oratoria]|uniref:exosome complex component RRP43-like isoform X2 n=1 Tax=Oratosquilla oratoria TaxID=337810 RepID=UPI003F766E08